LGEKSYVQGLEVREQEGVRPNGRSSVRWEKREGKCNRVDWVNMAQSKDK
jgi:hypothetical protein